MAQRSVVKTRRKGVLRNKRSIPFGDAKSITAYTNDNGVILFLSHAKGSQQKMTVSACDNITPDISYSLKSHGVLLCHREFLVVGSKMDSILALCQKGQSTQMSIKSDDLSCDIHVMILSPDSVIIYGKHMGQLSLSFVDIQSISNMIRNGCIDKIITDLNDILFSEAVQRAIKV